MTGHVTATRPPPHGHRHMATATRPPPHGHRHTVTATRSPPHGPATLGRVTCRVMWWVMCQVVSAPLTMGTYQGPLALGHSRRPLALWHPRPLLPLWPMATLFSWSTPFVNLGQWRPSSLGGLQPTAASGPWGTLGHDRLSGRRRH